MTKRFSKYVPDSYNYTSVITIVDHKTNKRSGSIDDFVELLNALNDENEQLKNKIDVLEDDNETYHKSLEKLTLYTKRFIPTKCTNEFKDCKTNRYYWLDHEGNFEGCLELLNLLDYENELLKIENRQLKADAEYWAKTAKARLKRIKELELSNDGLNYALQNIRKIDVEIDTGGKE